MFCFAVNLMKRRLGLACSVWLGLSASAQQVIQFSTPADSNPAQKANNFMPDHGNRNPDRFNAPSSLFANQVPDANFEDVAGNSANLAAAAAAQWRQHQERNKNWGLMTPEEILGIPTPEKLLGITEDDKDAKLSPEERFLKRQDQLVATSASNNLHSADLSIWHNETEDGRSVFQGVEAAGRTRLLNESVPGAPPNFESLFGRGTPDQSKLPVKAEATWTSPFALPATLPKPTAEQLAGMDRFRAYMEPALPDKTPTPSDFAIARTAPDPNMDPLPHMNLAGRAVPSLKHDIALPKGLTPLPGITGPEAPDKKPTPLVQPPPWLQDPLQNSSLPARQY